MDLYGSSLLIIKMALTSAMSPRVINQQVGSESDFGHLEFMAVHNTTPSYNLVSTTHGRTTVYCHERGLLLCTGVILWNTLIYRIFHEKVTEHSGELTWLCGKSIIYTGLPRK